MAKKLEKSTEIVQQMKKVAADGTKRGLQRLGSKNKRTQLLEQVQQAVEAHVGTTNWDPVVMMAVVAEQARVGYPAVDSEGNPVLVEKRDKHGNILTNDVTGEPLMEQLMVPPDPALAVAAAAKVAPYLHSQLRPKEKDDGEDAPDAIPAKERAEELVRRLGLGKEQPVGEA